MPAIRSTTLPDNQVLNRMAATAVRDTLISRGAADCRGNLIQDAYLAAIALEHNCTYVTTDSDYARFPGLRWRHPLD